MLAVSSLITACGGGGSSSESPSNDTTSPPVVVSPPVPPPTQPVPETPIVVPPVIETPVITTPPVVETPPEQPVTEVPVIIPPVTVTPPVTNPDPIIVPPVVVVPPVSTNELTPSSLLSNQAITTLTIDSTSTVNQQDIPVTFGQIFSVGDLQPNTKLTGRLGNGTLIALQTEVKATHADGSVRHAIISGVLPALAANKSVNIELLKSTYEPTASVLKPQDVLDKGFKAGVTITLGGVVYTANAQDVLNNTNGKKWLSGAVANEWIVSTPLKTASGVAHPHLQARFAVRTFNQVNKTKVDFTIENDWAFEPNPQNFTYDVKLTVGNNEVYSKTGLNHYNHARWRKVFWSAGTPDIHIRHETKYLIASKAVPNYDPTVKITTNALNDLRNTYKGGVTEPMGNGLATPYMPTTGGRQDIGLLPGWAVAYLLSMDKDAKIATLGTGDMAGSWSMHYRDKNTDRPVDLYDYPYMTINGRSTDTFNPATKKYEAFPGCSGDCSNPNSVDGAHEPEFVYLPYIVTGDYYYLEEVEFWAMYNSFATNPGYRGNILGLINSEQTRGQAWNLRNIAHAAYIIPDNDIFKSHLTTILNNNLDWFNKTYTENPTGDNFIGAILNGYSFSYANNTGIAGWQDDFFTSAIGHIEELGFTKAKSLLEWKARFPVSRMTDPNACWILGANYSYIIKPTSNGRVYTNWADIYKASIDPTVTATACASPEMTAALRKLPENGSLINYEMPGYSNYTAGYPSNMQPALAYSAKTSVPNAAKAWTVFMGRSVKPNYGDGAQFAIVPR